MPNEPLSFMARLKHHHIFRVASVYAIGAWVLIQLANSIFPDLGWPRQSVLILIVAVALLFPVVLILGWMFIPPSKEDPAKFSRWQRWHWRLGSVLSLALIALVTFSGVYLWRVNARHLRAETVVTSPPSAVTTSATTATTVIPAKSIAVLPFENLSDEKKNAYFAAGIQDLILTKLAHIGDLKVIARTSTENYGSHPKDLKTIARQLGVATILEGSVQKAGNQVLINVQLIDANTDSHLWAEAYTRTLDNIFGVEGEVAQKVADALKTTLTPAESVQIASLPTQNPHAYDLFLQGEYYRNRAESSYLVSDLDRAIQNYRAAIEQDPQFALAYARLAYVQLFTTRFTGADPHVFASAKLSIDRALKLAPTLAEAHLVQGYYDDYALNNLDAALAAFETARALKPQDAEIIFAIGINHKHRGQWDAAIQSYQQALALDPRNIITLGELAFAYQVERRYADAERVATLGLAINPESSVIRGYVISSILSQTGNINQAQAVLDAAPASVQSNPNMIYQHVALMFLRRDYSAALALVDRLPANKDVPVEFIEQFKGDVEWAAGDRVKAREHYLRAATLMEADFKAHPLNYRLYGTLGQVYARLGRSREALEQGRLGIKLESGEPIDGPYALFDMAEIQAELGDAGAAVPLLDQLLAMPTGDLLSVPELKLDPTWDPIRNDSRFQVLLKKYENKH